MSSFSIAKGFHKLSSHPPPETAEAGAEEAPEEAPQEQVSAEPGNEFQSSMELLVNEVMPKLEGL